MASVNQKGNRVNGPPQRLPSRPPVLRGIKGLVGRLEEVGKVKIGGKGEIKTSRSGKSFAQPVRYDHFVITLNQRDRAGNLIVDTALMEQLKQAYGTEKLTELDIVFLFDDIDLNFQYRLSYYGQGGVKCYGNGEIAYRIAEVVAKNEIVRKENGIWKEVACNPETCQFYVAGHCKGHGVLNFVIPQAPRIGGVYRFRTTGWNSIKAILGSLEYIQMLTGGILAMLPLKLVYRQKTIQDREGKLRSVPVVSIEYAGQFAKLFEDLRRVAEIRALARTDMKRLEMEARQALPAPGEEPVEEQEEVAQEFYPESVEKDISSYVPVEEGPAETQPSAERAGEPSGESPEPEQAVEPQVPAQGEQTEPPTEGQEPQEPPETPAERVPPEEPAAPEIEEPQEPPAEKPAPERENTDKPKPMPLQQFKAQMEHITGVLKEDGITTEVMKSFLRSLGYTSLSRVPAGKREEVVQAFTDWHTRIIRENQNSEAQNGESKQLF